MENKIKCKECDGTGKVESKKRTNSQNRGLHLFFTQLATVLNEMGLDMRTVLKPTYNLDWNSYNVKEHIWKPFQIAIMGEESTTKLKKTEGQIEKIHATIMRELGNRHGVEYIPFPSKCSECDSIDCICEV